MRAELIHTSVPRGLDGGTGFCVAGRTGGMPRALADALSALSGLPEAWSGASDSDRSLHATRCIAWQGESRWVASVIQPCGVDHTGRGNRIAHHRLLDPHEVAHACPVAILQDAGRWRQAWSGSPRELEAPREISAMSGAGRSTHWERALGDEGFAVAAMEAAMRSGVGAWIVVPAGADRLAMLAELAATVPLRQRWTRGWSTRALKPSAGAVPVICLVDAREPALESLGDPAWVIRAESLRPIRRSARATDVAVADTTEPGAPARISWQPERRLAAVAQVPDQEPAGEAIAVEPVHEREIPIAVTLEPPPTSRSRAMLWLGAAMVAVLALGWLLWKGGLA